MGKKWAKRFPSNTGGLDPSTVNSDVCKEAVDYLTAGLVKLCEDGKKAYLITAQADSSARAQGLQEIAAISKLLPDTNLGYATIADYAVAVNKYARIQDQSDPVRIPGILTRLETLARMQRDMTTPNNIITERSGGERKQGLDPSTATAGQCAAALKLLCYENIRITELGGPSRQCIISFRQSVPGTTALPQHMLKLKNGETVALKILAERINTYAREKANSITDAANIMEDISTIARTSFGQGY